MREQKNLIRKTKLRMLVLVVTALGMAFPAAAQEGIISLPVKRLSAREVFDNIQNQTRYKIAANNNSSDHLKVDITKSPMEVKTVLEKLLAGSGLTYSLFNDHIIITRDENSPASYRVVRNVSGTVAGEAGQALEGITVELVDFSDIRVITGADGRFMLSDVKPGRQYIKLTAPDGITFRYREINVPVDKNAYVNIIFSGDIFNSVAPVPAHHEAVREDMTDAYPVLTPNTYNVFAGTFPDNINSLRSSIKGAYRLPRFSIKTNLVHAATGTANLAGEVGLGRKTSLELYWGYNWIEGKDNKKWKHWIVQPAFRWWFCERANGGFMGVHLHAGRFNAGGVGPFQAIRNNRYEGNFYGAGISYGHHWIISNRWGFELELGMGYARMEYDKFGCAECSPKIESDHYNYFGPTKIAASFIFNLW